MEDVKKFEKKLGDRVAIFGNKDHTGAIKKGYKDPYLQDYLPVTAGV